MKQRHLAPAGSNPKTARGSNGQCTGVYRDAEDASTAKLRRREERVRTGSDGRLSSALRIHFGRLQTGVCHLRLLPGISAVPGHVAIVALATLGFGVTDLMMPLAWPCASSAAGTVTPPRA